ncbi:MAG: sulfite exporter TauE/SafE family protein [Burkholderiales bacterium]|nr:sulfite exporter TauE/SafE family protein [Burkholderiales bacterium]
MFAIFLFTGLVSGFLAGLLGVGGGIVNVPALDFAFSGTPHSIHSAVATSLAVISFTSFLSLRIHNRKQAVRWDVFRSLTPGILAGTFAGSQIAIHLPPHLLRTCFALFVMTAAVRMFLGGSMRASGSAPGAGGMTAAGFVIGAISTLVGIGGGSLTVPFLSWCGLPLIETIGTSAAIGFPISFAATLQYAAEDFDLSSLQEFHLGLIHLPALALIVSGSLISVPYGARLAHRLPVPLLRRLFAILLALVGVKMLISSVTLPSFS